MLKRLIAFSIENAALVIVLALALLAGTAYFVPRMPVDVFPELNAPTVVVLTEAGGFAPDEVEQYVTVPIESAVNGLPGVRRVRSGSALGLSLVWVEFDWGHDIYLARQIVGEGLDSVAEQLPEQAHMEIAPITGITGEIMLLSLTNDADEATPPVDPLELRAFAEFDMRTRLMAVPGVAQVVAIGGELPEYQIDARQDRLRLYGLSMEEVVEAAKASHSTASAGYLTNVRGVELPLRQTARVRSVDDIANTIVRYHQGVAVTIGQVADVRLGPAIARGSASDAGKPAVVIGVKKAPFTNTLRITEDVDRTLDGLEAALPPGATLNRHVMRQADFINVSMLNVQHVLRDAAIFVSIVLVLFLLNIRTTIITLTAIPLSIAMALLVMHGLGQTVNVMTLGGLAIAIGVVVDDGIIDVENVFRRLRQNAALPMEQRRSRAAVVIDASNEIRGSIMFATLIIVIVFLPLLFLTGVEGRFFRPMGLTYVVSILASLVVALTVVPAMCYLLLRGGERADAAREERDGVVVRSLKWVYEPTVRVAIRLRWLVLVVALTMTGGSIWLAGTYGTDFLPDFNEGTFTIFIDAPPGTSLTESDRMVRGLDQRLAEVEGVRAVVRRTGRAERDEHAHGVNRSEIEVSVLPGHDKAAVQARIDDVLDDLPGVNTEIGAPIGHRLSHVLSGTQAAIAIDVFGEDLATLREIARQIEAELNTVPGARDVLANREARIESLPIRYRHDDLARWGLTPADAARQVETAFNGVVVAQVHEGIRLYDIVVRLAPDQRRNPDDVKGLLLRGRSPGDDREGPLVRLSEVATIGAEHMPLGISRENAQRKAVISLNVAEGFNLGHVIEAVRQRVDPIVARYGYHVEYGGQFEAQQSAARTLYLFGAFVGVIVLVRLSTAFHSMRAAVLVMINLPLALIGGVVSIFITESPDPLVNLAALFNAAGGVRYQAPVISIASMVGFVTLFGIAVRNGLLLVNHYAHLMRHEGCDFDEAVIRGSSERLVPILMTALTAVLGLLPLALAAGEPGSELLAPLAIVVLGGLVTSTLLNLVVVPAGYFLIFKRSPIRWPEHSADSTVS